MGLVIETCVKYSGGPTRITVTDICTYMVPAFIRSTGILINRHVHCCMLWNTGGYVRCRASAVPAITGVWEWRIGGEGEERKEYQQLTCGGIGSRERHQRDRRAQGEIQETPEGPEGTRGMQGRLGGPEGNTGGSERAAGP